MAEFAERSPAARAVAPPSGGPAPAALAAAPRVQQLVQRAAALNDARAPVQLNGKDGDKKKSNNKKQEKQKAATAGLKKKKQRKEDEIVRSYGTYTSDKRSRKQVVNAIRELDNEGVKLKKGHRSKNSNFKMNSATQGTMGKITDKLKGMELNEKKTRSRRDDSDVEEEEAELDLDLDDEPSYKPRYRKDDDDDPPPPPVNEISAY